MANILELYEELVTESYRHGGYERFTISDPKPRIIHKASVRDRLLHHAIYRRLYPFFDRTFVSDSYSCRLNKGSHKAIARFRRFAHALSANGTKTVWMLKCDIRKFFDSVDQAILIELLSKYISDPAIRILLNDVVASFEAGPGRGLPLGNLTSQLLVNIYMNEFDQFVKRSLHMRHYIRYADDFIILSRNRAELEHLIPAIEKFLGQELKLSLHPRKVSIETFASGIDFLGWVHFPSHSVLRTSTKRRMMKNIRGKPEPDVLASYHGLLSHGNTFELRQELDNAYGLFHNPYLA